MFDAGSVAASLTINPSQFDRVLDAAEARVKKFEDDGHKVKLSAVFDATSMSRARQQFAQLDQAISKDAMSRLRSSPQGSVLGALNALFSPHPVTGAPTAQQAASQGLLGKMVSSPGGGGPPLAGDSRITGSAQNGTSLGSVLEQAANVTTTDKVKPVLTGPQPGDVNTTDTIKQNLTGQAPGDVTTTDTINRKVTGAEPGNISTTDTIKEKLDPASAAQAEKDSGASGDRSGTSFAGRFTSHLKGLLGKSVTDTTEKAAGDSGDRSGTRFTVGFGGHMGPFFAGLTKTFGDAGGKGGAAMGTGLLGGIGPGILGISAKFSGIVGLAGSALGALPALAGIAGVGTGVALIGGIVGVVSKGAIAAVQPAVTAFQALQNAAPGPKQVAALAAYQQQLALLTPAQKSLATSLEGMQGAWANFVKSNTAGVATIISGGIGLVPGILASVSGVFRAVVPQMQSVFQSLDGVIQGLLGVAKTAVPAFAPFINAVLGLVSNVLPGLSVVIKATIPFISQFAGILGNLGKDLGSLFATAAPAIGASMQILSGLLGLVGDLLPVVTKLADIFATALAPVFVQFTGVIRTLLPPLVQIGTVIAAFAGAVIGDLASAFGAVATLVKALAPSLAILAATLTSVFTILENTGVFAVFGDALENLALPIAKLVNALVTGLAPVLPVLVNAAAQLSTVLVGALSAALGAVLTAAVPVVTVVAEIVTAVVSFLQNTGLLLPVMAGLGLAFGPVASGLRGMAAGLSLLTGSSFGVVITGMVGSLREFMLATEGVTLAQKAQLAGMLALDAVSPLGWAVIAGVAVAGLVVGLNQLAKGSHDLVDQLTAQDNATGYNISGYQKLAGQLTTVSASFTAMAQSSGNAVKGQGGQLGQVAQQYSATATAMQALAVNMQGRLTTLSANFGVSQTQIEKWATAAGISATKFGGAGENVGLLTQQIVGYVNKNAAAITATASLGTNMAIFGNDAFNATTQLDAFNGIWETLVGNLLTKQEAVTNSDTAFDNLGQTIKNSGANSDSAKQSFQQYIAQIGSSASTLLQQGASINTVNGYLQGQIDHIGTLGPLNAGEKADLAGLKAAQDAYANSTNGLNTAQKTLIDQFEAHLIPDLASMGANTPKVNTDISNLANSIIQTGNNSASTATDRANLIKDLENAGLNAHQATAYVDGLQTKIDGLKGKVVNVGLTTSGSGEIIITGTGITTRTINTVTGQVNAIGGHTAKGWLVSGGTPGVDSVPILAMAGELVVPKGIVASGAVDHLRGTIPGFAAGGLVGAVSAAEDTAGAAEASFGQAAASAFAQAAVTAAQAQMKALAAAAAAAGSPVAYSKVAGVTQWETDVSRVLSMLGLPQADLPTVMAQILTESGGNPNAINLTDSNAAAGDPSKGLMQVISGTFAAYRDPALSANIYDPLANIYAGVNYAVHRYGNPGWLSVLGHGHGYANGGMITEPVLGYGMHSGDRYVLGERGSETVTPIGGTRGGKTVDDLAARLDQLHADMQQMVTATRQVPAGVGQHVGGAINGAAHDASFRSRYPRGGS